MKTKKIGVTVPENLTSIEMLEFVTKELKEYTDVGWKVGGVIHSKSLNKTVIIYKDAA